MIRFNKAASSSAAGLHLRYICIFSKGGRLDPSFGSFSGDLLLPRRKRTQLSQRDDAHMHSQNARAANGSIDRSVHDDDPILQPFRRLPRNSHNYYLCIQIKSRAQYLPKSDQSVYLWPLCFFYGILFPTRLFHQAPKCQRVWNALLGGKLMP